MSDNTSLTPNRNNFYENFVKQFGNGKKLMEDFDEFIAQTHQILISKGRRKEKVKNVAGKNSNNEAEYVKETIESMDVEQQRRKAAIDSSKLMTAKPIDDNDGKIGLTTERRIKRRILDNRLIKELRQEMEDRPEEVRGDEPETTIFASSSLSRRAEVHRQYEEKHFVRLGLSREERKLERMQRHQSLAGNQLERELLKFGQYRLPDPEKQDDKPNGRKNVAGNKFKRNKRGNGKTIKKSKIGFKKKKHSQVGKRRSKRGGKKVMNGQ